MCGLLVVPAAASAASAILITDTVAMFTVEISIPTDTFETELPIAASDKVLYNDRVNITGFTIEDVNGEPVTGVTSKALLLGTAAITTDNRYRVDIGTTATFTLLIISTFDKAITEPYRARITKLPYWLNGQRTSVHQNQLDEFVKPALAI